MTDKEKIRAEVDRLHSKWMLISTTEGYYKCKLCNQLLKFIDSLQEEPVSEDLEEASRNYADDEEYGDDVYFAIKVAFETGAKWQKEKDDEEKVLTYKHGFEDCKEQMMKDAVSGIVHLDVDKNPYEYVIRTGAVKGMRHGTCLNLIIIKED